MRFDKHNDCILCNVFQLLPYDLIQETFNLQVYNIPIDELNAFIQLLERDIYSGMCTFLDNVYITDIRFSEWAW